jgi:hypothetical protein
MFDEVQVPKKGSPSENHQGGEKSSREDRLFLEATATLSDPPKVITQGETSQIGPKDKPGATQSKPAEAKEKPNGKQTNPNDRPQGELSPAAQIEEISEFIRQGTQPADYNQIWPDDVPVMFYGEDNHKVQAFKTEAAEYLRSFKPNGANANTDKSKRPTHLAMEMLNEKDQPLINRYLDGKATRDEVLNLFKENWNWAPGIPEKYMDMVDAAKEANMKILCLNSPNAPVAEMNANWARIMGQTLRENPNARIFAYSGEAHTGYSRLSNPKDIAKYGSVNEILAQRFGHKSVVVDTSGGAKYTDQVGINADKLGEAARLTAKDQQRFMVPLKRDEVPREADYLVHLPQKEKEPSLIPGLP